MGNGGLKKYRPWIITALIYWGVSAVVLLSSYHVLSQEADGTNCASGVVGLCTPGTFESSTETVTETTQTDGTGTTTTTTTTTDTTTTTVTVPETGDLLTDSKVQEMGRNQKFGGDMTSDWGGQGGAGIRNGATCGALGTDKCAEMTGSGSFTSTHGQTGIGTTFKQTINMSSIDPDIERGGQVPWSIRVEKRDASDSIHFRIRKSDGTDTVLLGTETLSAAGANAITNTLFQGNFSFSGAMTSLSIEVSGRDINLAIGPLFDDVTVNVIYNVVNTIVTQTITTIEEFVALGTFDQETIDVATDIFENNNIVETDTGLSIEPIEEPTSESSYESVSAEITEMVAPELQAPTIEVSVVEPQSVEIQVETQNVETEMQTEMSNDDITNEVSSSGGVASNEDSPQEGGGSVSSGEQDEKPEPAATAAEEAEPEEEAQSGPSSVKEKKEEPKEQPKKVAEKKVEKPKTKVEKKQEAKEKAASKIVKKMGDKGRYDDSNQLKTLVVMQVLGNTKTFFDNQTQLQDMPGFFDNRTVPDNVISDNNYSAYIMFGGSDAAHNALTESQYR